ncbi:MAG: hypothetical protein O7H41_02850 [Planctomycetota bacterium]|nr:hypothetical protein [Planctomycetota bacterium]
MFARTTQRGGNVQGRFADAAGHTFMEMAVVMIIFLVMVLAVGSAFGTGGQVFGEGLFLADLNAHARRVLNRIMEEMGETQSNSPDFAVGDTLVTYNKVESVSATAATFGPTRRISHNGSTEKITMSVAADGIAEELSGEASGLTFALDGSRLTITVSISKTNSEGTYVTQTVTGDVNIHR